MVELYYNLATYIAIHNLVQAGYYRYPACWAVHEYAGVIGSSLFAQDHHQGAKMVQIMINERI